MDSIKRGIQFKSEFRDQMKFGEAAKIETELRGTIYFPESKQARDLDPS
jgi:hypothetical protein